jgi:adenylosuccinate lyase
VRNLRIDADRMHENLISTGAAVVSERLNVNLTPLVGKLKAKEILRRLLLGGGGDPATLVPKLRNELSVLGVDAEAIVRLLAADDYIGASEEIARRAIARSEAFDAPATPHRFSGRGGE